MPANTSPATTISSDPATSVRRRPRRSALVVSHSEIRVSPISVSVRTIPTWQRVEAERVQVEDEDDREEPVREHAEGPHQEQQPRVPVEPAQARDQAGVDGGGAVTSESTNRGGGRRGLR